MTNRFKEVAPKIVQLYKDGNTYKEIAKALNTSESTIKKSLSQVGISKRRVKGQKIRDNRRHCRNDCETTSVNTPEAISKIPQLVSTQNSKIVGNFGTNTAVSTCFAENTVSDFQGCVVFGIRFYGWFAKNLGIPKYWTYNLIQLKKKIASKLLETPEED